MELVHTKLNNISSKADKTNIGGNKYNCSVNYNKKDYHQTSANGTACTILKLGTKTKGSTDFRNLKALGYSDQSVARALLRA